VEYFSVSDELPEDFKEVLGFCRFRDSFWSGWTGVKFCRHSGWSVANDLWENTPVFVSHWAKLPERPSREQGDKL